MNLYMTKWGLRIAFQVLFEFLTTDIPGEAQLTCHLLLREQAFNFRKEPMRTRINPGEKIGLGSLKIRVSFREYSETIPDLLLGLGVLPRQIPYQL